MILSHNPLDDIISPIDNVHVFMHCSGGDITVTKYKFDTVVLPMLKLHGIDIRKITWQTAKMLSAAGSEKEEGTGRVHNESWMTE